MSRRSRGGVAKVLTAEDPELLILYSLVFLHGAGRAFHGPALHAIVPNIVPRKVLDSASAG